MTTTFGADTDRDSMMTETEAAALLGLQPATIRRWRSAPPPDLPPLPFVKYGTSRSATVRYRRADVIAWRDAQLRGATPEAGERAA